MSDGEGPTQNTKAGVVPADPPSTGEPQRRALLGCDGFLLALDSMMRRAGQGAHISQSVVELDALPDVTALRQTWRGFMAENPIVSAKLRRGWRGLPTWKIPAPPGDPSATPVHLWRETGAPDDLPGAEPAQSLEQLCLTLRDQRRPNKKRPPFSLRLDVLRRAESATVIVTWSHLHVDGKGVEFLLMELGRRLGGFQDQPTAPASQPMDALARTTKKSSLRQMIDRSRAFVEHFYQLAATKFHSLSGPRLAKGRVFCEVVTLDAELTAKVNARAEKLTSQLINTPFFLAAAAVAHGKVFEHRGKRDGAKGEAGPQVITLPIQTRPKGGRGPIFQNWVTILFFRLDTEQLHTTEDATAEVQAQFLAMMRKRLDSSFSMMLDLMRWMPPRLYSFFLRVQMRGEITSFFHSYTGGFAPGLRTLAGGKIRNAWHIPVISTPPGTGLFLGEQGGRLSVSLSWRDGAIDENERALLMRAYLEELVGEPVETGKIDRRLAY